MAFLCKQAFPISTWCIVWKESADYLVLFALAVNLSQGRHVFINLCLSIAQFPLALVLLSEWQSPLQSFDASRTQYRYMPFILCHLWLERNDTGCTPLQTATM